MVQSTSVRDFHPLVNAHAGRTSSRERRLTAPSHTTGHAGPHPAVRQVIRSRWYRSCVGLPFVSCRRSLDPLVSPQRLHRLPLSSSTPIQGSLSSGLISRTAQRSSYLTFGPSQPVSTWLVLLPLLTPAASAWPRDLGYHLLWLDDRSPQVRTLTFPAHLPHLLLWPLIASGFVVTCQLARPHSLLCGSCSSSRRFASGFLQTPPRGDALALG